MKKWLIGLGAIAGIAILGIGSYFGYFAYRLYFHGPAALHRIEVSKPATIVHYGDDALQYAELRLPAGKGPFPVAVVIHGGCWKAGMETLAGTAPLADALTRRGIATLNIEYRQLGDAGGGWPGTFQDVGAAIDSLRGLSQTYPIDLKRLSVVGHSAGAHLALWSAVRPKLPDASEIRGEAPLPPANVVAIDGPGTLAEFIGQDARICGEPVIVPFMGGEVKTYPARYAEASPQDHLPLGVRQLLVGGAFTDLMQPYVHRAQASGDSVQVYMPKNGKHFDIINPTQTQGKGTVEFIVTHTAP